MIGQRVDHCVVPLMAASSASGVAGVDHGGVDIERQHSARPRLIDDGELVVAGFNQQAGNGVADMTGAEVRFSCGKELQWTNPKF